MIPKTLQKLQDKHPDKIDEIEDDRGNDNGYWIHLKDHCADHIGMGHKADGCRHSIHKFTAAECASAFRDIKKCYCENCKPLKLTGGPDWSNRHQGRN